MSKYISSAALALAIAAAPGVASAQGNSTNTEIVVTATRASKGVPREQLGGSVSVLSPQDLQLRQVQSFSDVLRDVPGIEVSRTGAIGNMTQVRIRGAEANHTLALIDGMDASDIVQGELDFSSLIADDLARVEVLRGQQSALYGSDAIGGVIHYITATGREAPGARGRFEYGSFNTGQLSARVAGFSGPFDWAVSGNVFDTEGTPEIENGSRDLAFNSKAIAGRFGLQLSEDFSIGAVLRARQVRGDFNPDTDFDGLNEERPGAHYERDAAWGLVRADLSTFNEAWTHALVLQRMETDNATFDTVFPDFNEGDRNKASYTSTWHFGKDSFEQNLTGAIDYRDETFSASSITGERSFEQTGYVIDYNALVNKRLGIGVAARHDTNNMFDNATTYRAQASYAFDTGTRIRAAAGSGIKNPTMFELFGFFGNFVPNPDLIPEESEGWEAGVEQHFFDRDVLVGVTYFDSEFTNRISSVGNTPVNVAGESTQKGVEVFVNADLGPQWSIDLAYTNLDAEEPGGPTGTRKPVRRADNIASANISWRTVDDRGGLNLNVRYNGEQEDTDFVTFQRVTLDAFTLVTLGADWQLTDALQVYGRVENATDEDYVEISRAETPGRAVYVGLRAGF